MKTIYSILCLCFTILQSFTVQAGVFTQKNNFLPPEQAFIFEAKKHEQGLELHWQIAEGYYLYKKELRLEGANGQLLTMDLPTAQQYQDEFFGTVEIYRHQLVIPLPLSQLQDNSIVTIAYQGCTQGFCYPPEEKQLKVADLLLEAKTQPKNIDSAQSSSASAFEPERTVSRQEQLAAELAQSKFAVFGFFLLGIGLAFTPCVLPMLPLLSAIVIGQGKRPDSWRAFALSFVYVQGMALTYSLLGLIVAAIGLPFQIALQSPLVLIGLSAVFVLLALSMFGCFTLQLPVSIQTKLNQYSQRQQSGAFGGVFVMGLLAGLVASPCTSAPLSGALLYVAQSGDLLTGAFTLYLLALGMGLPLMLITIFGNKILPRSGNWLNAVKTAFGFVMLALPIFLLGRVWGQVWEIRLWSILLTSFLIWLSFQLPKQGILLSLRILCLVGAMLAVKPVQNWLWSEQVDLMPHDNQLENTKSSSSAKFQQISDYSALQQLLAQNNNTVVMVDFYADWCVACKEFETQTFSSAQVQASLASMTLVRVDMTNNTAGNKALMERFQILGLPTILFLDSQGQEISGSRITGFMPANEFLDWLKTFSK